jgi:hypothetical protein
VNTETGILAKRAKVQASVNTAEFVIVVKSAKPQGQAAVESVSTTEVVPSAKSAESQGLVVTVFANTIFPESNAGIAGAAVFANITKLDGTARGAAASLGSQEQCFSPQGSEQRKRNCLSI